MANTLAWGFHRLENIADQSVSTNIDAVRTAVNEYLAFRNAENQAVLNTFAEVTTGVSARYKLPGTMRLQPLTQLGRPLPERYAETEYTIAWPIQKAGLALGQTYEQRIKMDIRGFAGLIEAVGDADMQWVADHALAALFFNVTAGWFHDDPDDPAGELTIRGIANGDSQTYYKTGSSTFFATDDHFYVQAADLLTATDPVPAVVDELKEHPQNTGEVLILGSAADRVKWANLAAMYAQPNPNITVGSGTTVFSGAVPGAPLGEFAGYHLSDAYVYLWRRIPAGYFVAFMTGGDKPLRQREHPEAQLRGFGPDADRSDYPYFETDYVRRAGFGAWNRVGAVVGRFNNGTYAIPTGFGSPMP